MRQEQARRKLGRRRRPVARELLRWWLCLTAAALVQGYAWFAVLTRSLSIGSSSSGRRADAFEVGIRTEGATPETPLRRELAAAVPDPGALTPEAPRQAKAKKPPPGRVHLRKSFQGDRGGAMRAFVGKAGITDRPPDISPEALLKGIEDRLLHDPTVHDMAKKSLSDAVQLTERVSTRSIQGVGDYLGFGRGEYVPKNPPPPGRFDFSDATHHSIEKATHDDGTPTYRLTLVDRAGRTLTFLIPKGEDLSGYHTLHRVMQAGRANPKLGLILHRMALPLLGRLRKKMQRPPTPRPRRPAPPSRDGE